MSGVHLEAAQCILGTASMRIASRLRHVFIALHVTVGVAVGVQCPVFAESQHSNSTDTPQKSRGGLPKRDWKLENLFLLEVQKFALDEALRDSLYVELLYAGGWAQ
mgnify:CR=1 FL=1